MRVRSVVRIELLRRSVIKDSMKIRGPTHDPWFLCFYKYIARVINPPLGLYICLLIFRYIIQDIVFLAVSLLSLTQWTFFWEFSEGYFVLENWPRFYSRQKLVSSVVRTSTSLNFPEMFFPFLVYTRILLDKQMWKNPRISYFIEKDLSFL